MQVNKLEIKYFRNFESSALEFDEKINVFYGKNGAGKTNILEAIFVLLLARSPRGAADTVMVNNASDYYRLEGVTTIDNFTHELAVAYQKNSRKRITIDKVTARASELFEKSTAVSTAPQDIEILSGSPSNRRDFINIYLSQASNRYLSDLSDYQKVLAQKNAFLKLTDNGGETPYDELMVQYGSSIILKRKEFLEEIGDSAATHYKEISGGQKLDLAYKPSVTLENKSSELDEIKIAFEQKLSRNKKRESILQTSMVGPHRDDIEFYIRDYPARSHGSQGELRSAAISLKLAVFDYLVKKKKNKPILLLDEIFAELDRGRKDMLVELFDKFGQIFLTTASDLPESLSARGRKFKVENGVVTAE